MPVLLPEPVCHDKAVETFNFDGHSIRIQIDEKGDEWFCAKDVCDRLGLSNSRETLSGLALDDDEKKGVRVSDALGKNPQTLSFVSLPAVFKLISRSNKPEAKAFDRKVRHEILPQIRKTGRYIVDGANFAALAPSLITDLPDRDQT